MFNKYDVYTTFGSKYCYKDSNVLRNKLNIKDYELLKQAETDIVSVKQNYLLSNPISGYFSMNHFCRIHEFLFCDIYNFAGHFRTETIKKGDTTFLNSTNIKPKMVNLLKKLRIENLLANMDYDEFVYKLTYYFAELNYYHPFREGNGRATREFIRQLCEFNCYEIDWGKIDTIVLLDAMVESVYNRNNLEHVIKICISKLK